MKTSIYLITLAFGCVLSVALLFPAVAFADYAGRYDYYSYSDQFNAYQGNPTNYYQTSYPTYHHPRPTPRPTPPPVTYTYNYHYSYNPAPVYAYYYAPPAPISLPVYTYVPVYPVNVTYVYPTPFVSYYR